MKLPKLTVVAYAVFAATGLSLWSLERVLDGDPGTFVRLLMLTLVLSMLSIGFGLALFIQTWRRRAKIIADLASGEKEAADIEPSDRMMNP